jgi:hypothetical protein
VLNRGHINANLQKLSHRLRNFSLYNDSEYSINNPDVKNYPDMVDHFWKYGYFENRKIYSEMFLLKILPKIDVATKFDSISNLDELMKYRGGISLNILVANEGNFFMSQFAENISKEMKSLFFKVSLLKCNRIDIQSLRNHVNLVIAPHEFYRFCKMDDETFNFLIHNSYVFNTEQASTKWFIESLPFLILSKGNIDINYQVSQVVRTINPNSHFFEPRATSFTGSDQVGKDSYNKFDFILNNHLCRCSLGLTDRYFTFCFFGNSTSRRDSILTKINRILTNFNSHIYLKSQNSLRISPIIDELSVRKAHIISSHSSILLNFHQSDVPYFEWDRIVNLGFANGCLVFSENTLEHPFLKENKHFVVTDNSSLEHLCDYYLGTIVGIAEARKMIDNSLAYLNDYQIRKYFKNNFLRMISA